MSVCYMLDTNSASYIIKGKPASVKERLISLPMESIGISVITEAELLRGLAKVPEATRLAEVVKEFLIRVDILPWGSVAAQAYAHLRAACEKEGKSLSAMDMLIAAHSVAAKVTLVTNDKAFYEIEHLLALEDWVL